MNMWSIFNSEKGTQIVFFFHFLYCSYAFSQSTYSPKEIVDHFGFWFRDFPRTRNWVQFFSWVRWIILTHEHFVVGLPREAVSHPLGYVGQKTARMESGRKIIFGCFNVFFFSTELSRMKEDIILELDKATALIVKIYIALFLQTHIEAYCFFSCGSLFSQCVCVAGNTCYKRHCYTY